MSPAAYDSLCCSHTPVIRHRYRRDKVSAISAVTVSARRRRCGLYIHFYPGSNPCGGRGVPACLAPPTSRPRHRPLGRRQHSQGARCSCPAHTRCPRLHIERFPGYAPDLNPDEFVWTHFKATLNVEELMTALCRITKKARKRPELLRSFIAASELPALLRSECLLVMHMSISPHESASSYLRTRRSAATCAQDLSAGECEAGAGPV